MPQEELGYVELEWTCKNCGTRNPGSRKTCMNCGAAMGAQDKFALPAQQELIKDADTLAQAKQAPDVRCPFCGTLNPANARSCKQCGGDLQGAVARVQGGVLGAFDDSKQPDVKCPNCGTLNPASATICSNCGATLSRPASPVATLPATATLAPRVPAAGLNPLLIGAAVVLLLLCIGGGIWFITRTSESAATVSSLNWQRTIAIQALVPIQHADWQDQVPSDAQIKSCELKPRH